jgi:hypothetical protein
MRDTIMITNNETETVTSMPEEIRLILSGPTVAALRGATATNDVRFYLAGWCLDAGTGADGAHLVATNGNAMVVAPLNLKGPDLAALRGWLGEGGTVIIDPCTGINLGRGAVNLRIRPLAAGGCGGGVSVALSGTKGPVAGAWFVCDPIDGKYPDWCRVDAWLSPDGEWSPGTGAYGVDVSLMAPIWGGGWAFWHREDSPWCFRCSLLVAGKCRDVPHVRVTLMGMRWL